MLHVPGRRRALRPGVVADNEDIATALAICQLKTLSVGMKRRLMRLQNPIIYMQLAQRSSMRARPAAFRRL